MTGKEGVCATAFPDAAAAETVKNVLRFTLCILSRHSQDRIHDQRADPDRDHVFPANVHQLIITEAGESAAEPDHDINDHPNLEHEPEQSDDCGIDGIDEKR